MDCALSPTPAGHGLAVRADAPYHPRAERCYGDRLSRAMSASSPTVAVAMPPAPPRGEHSWIADRLLPLFLLGLALPTPLFPAWRRLDWLEPGGRPFPGFFVMENGIVPTVGLFHWTGMVHHMPFAARIVAVDGTPVNSNADVYARAAAVPVGA